MKCPKCNNELREEKVDTILVNRCDQCGGMWVSQTELTELEDEAWKDEDDKGELEFNKIQSNLNCPECNAAMVRFNYRYSDLLLDACPNLHGFWLDKGEDKQIEEIMIEDKADYERKIKAEDKWNNTLRNMQSRGFMEKVKSLLKL